MARRPTKGAVARTTTFPAPVGGWNARDSLSDMADADAVQMVNWFPGTSDVFLRPGREVWAYGLPAAVETLFDYHSPTAEKFFAYRTGAGYIVNGPAARGEKLLSRGGVVIE